MNNSIDYAEITREGISPSITSPKHYNDNFRTNSQITSGRKLKDQYFESR